MSSIIISNCEALNYFYDCCQNNSSEGRISAVAWVRKGVWGTPAFNETTIHLNSVWQGIVNRNYGYIIQDVRGQYDGSQAVEAPGYGRNLTRLQGRTHQVTYSHLFTWAGNSNTSGAGLTLHEHNVDFYNWLNRQNDYEFYFVTQHHIWRIERTAMSFTQIPISENIENSIEYVVTVKWGNLDLPKPYLKCSNGACAEVFDDCEFLNPNSPCWTPNDAVRIGNCTP